MGDELKKVPDPLTHGITRLGVYQRSIIACDFPMNKEEIRTKLRMSASHFAVSTASLIQKGILVSKDDDLDVGPNFELVNPKK